MTQAHTAEMLLAIGLNRGNGSANTHRTKNSKFMRETWASENLKKVNTLNNNKHMFESDSLAVLSERGTEICSGVHSIHAVMFRHSIFRLIPPRFTAERHRR